MRTNLPNATRRCLAALSLAALLLAGAGTSPAPATVTVFAAASTVIALDDVAAAFAARGMGTVRVSYASTSFLAKQIVNGAPADVFLAASTAWMDYVEAKGAIAAASRFDLLGNRLVLVAPTDSPVSVHIEPGFGLAAVLGGERMAMGDPDHVPAGIYAKAALRALGVWPAVEARVARASDVRAALALVQRREVGAAIVYATDALAARGIRVVATFPDDSHPPIVYPVALTASGRSPEARRFHCFVQSSEAAAVFTRHGFSVMPGRAR